MGLGDPGNRLQRLRQDPRVQRGKGPEKLSVPCGMVATGGGGGGDAPSSVQQQQGMGR